MSVSKWARANIKTSVKLSTHSVLNVVHREAIMVCHTLAFDSHRLGAILLQNYNFLKLMVFSWSVIESFWAYDAPIISHLYFTTDWSLEMLDTRGPYVFQPLIADSHHSRHVKCYIIHQRRKKFRHLSRMVWCEDSVDAWNSNFEYLCWFLAKDLAF